jgi:hypothetical protein
MNWIEIIGHLANIIYIVALLFKDMIRLRIILMVAAILELAYSLQIADENIWVTIWWSFLWIAVNSFQIAMIIRERMNLKFTDEEKRLHNNTFSLLSELNFRQLLNEAYWRTIKNGEILVKEGTVINDLMVVFDGMVEVESGGRVIAQLRNGSFVGEMSFISGNLTSANVYAITDTKIICWNKDKLRKLMQHNSEIQSGMHSVLNTDLTTKLKRKVE